MAVRDLQLSNKDYLQMRVPVLNLDGSPAMPTKPSRARRWLRDGKAKVVHNELNIFCIQLIEEPSGRETQDVVVGIDPGKLFSGIGVASAKSTLFLAHLVLPFPNVTKKMTSRRILRRTRRGRRINRKVVFNLRAHRQKRFNNRRQGKLPPSIRANKQLELQVVKEVMRLFPVSSIVYEVIKAKGNKGFSPVMVGQSKQLEWLSKLALTTTQEGWQTSILRRELGLAKNKEDKSAQTPKTHANDGLALAASHFVRYEAFHTSSSHGHKWNGRVELTPAPFRVIARPNIYRRQLHFENPVANAPNHRSLKKDLPSNRRKPPDPQTFRKRKGGTVTPFGFRSGDLVRGEKAGKVYTGWIGGYTQSERTKNVSIYDHNWKRIGQFSPTRVQLLQRSTRLCVAS